MLNNSLMRGINFLVWTIRKVLFNIQCVTHPSDETASYSSHIKNAFRETSSINDPLCGVIETLPSERWLFKSHSSGNIHFIYEKWESICVANDLHSHLCMFVFSFWIQWTLDRHKLRDLSLLHRNLINVLPKLYRNLSTIRLYKKKRLRTTYLGIFLNFILFKLEWWFFMKLAAK